jgi:molybdate transport system ATP-binding protein
MSMLDAHIVVSRATFELDIRLSISAGEVVALLGPNGAGKTTALRALAGLQPLHDGHITLDDTTVDDPARSLWTPPNRRSIGLVFQDYLLFPHLSARDNVAFGLRHHGYGRKTARDAAEAWLQRMDLLPAARMKPRNLSGGQQQRVALARALAVGPSLLLLDEPLAALDARTRLDTRADLQRHLRESQKATLIVTHDPLDALVLADRLVIVEDGRIVQEGDAATITAAPQTDYVARLVGLNLYRGRATGRTVAIASGFELSVNEAATGTVFVAFAPSAVALYPQRPDGSPRNTWRATVTEIQRHGDNLRVSLAGPIGAAADITPAAAAQLRLSRGQQVWAVVKAVETRTYPATAPIPATAAEARSEA